MQTGPKTNLNHHSRITLIFVTKLNIGTEKFYSPFLWCFENKQVIECIESNRLNVASPTNYSRLPIYERLR